MDITSDTTATTNSGPHKKEKILLIESETVFADKLADMLRKDGYVVYVEKEGAAGLKAIYDLMPHLIMVDVVLPGMDGYQILEKKAAEPLLTKIPVFLLSTQGVPINIQRIPQGSVKEYILDLHADPVQICTKVDALFGHPADAVSGTAATASSSAKKKVMWVEDDKLIGSILARKLISFGFDLTHARDGDEAIKMLSEVDPDVIILDLLVPGIGGFDVLQRIKATPRLAKVPVMVLSNLNKQSDIDRVRILGADKFMVKAAASLDQIVMEIKGLCK